MRTYPRIFTRFAGALLATATVALAITVAPAVATLPPPGPGSLTTPPAPAELTAWVTVDCDDFTDPIRIHVTNNSDQVRSVEIDDGLGYGWSLEPGETRQGPVYFDTIEMDSASVSVSVKEGDEFFSQVIPFEHSCFGASPNYSLNFNCDIGVATVLFTNHAITPTTVGVVYPPEWPADFEYITYISPVEMVLDISPGETVHMEFYGDGHGMFNGDVDFECGPVLVAEIVPQTTNPAPEPGPAQLKWIEYMVRQLRVALRWMALVQRF